jgi:hypothetical protein
MKNITKNISILMMFAIVFTIGLQSVHMVFGHDVNKQITFSKDSFSKSKLQHEDDCKVCDFEFASFLQTDVFYCTFFKTNFQFVYNNPFLHIVKEKQFTLFSRRGPPIA